MFCLYAVASCNNIIVCLISLASNQTVIDDYVLNICSFGIKYHVWNSVTCVFCGGSTLTFRTQNNCTHLLVSGGGGLAVAPRWANVCNNTSINMHIVGGSAREAADT